MFFVSFYYLNEDVLVSTNPLSVFPSLNCPKFKYKALSFDSLRTGVIQSFLPPCYYLF